ncbi:MAG: Gamma-glutamyltranspeptidase precursor, partial [Verrucomicrobiota bacterium]
RNAVALTYTLEYGYGSRIVVPGAGFLLNNEMGDFNAVPGLTDETGLIGTTPNLARPGKRMLSSMSPTILTKDGQLFMVTGAMGGRTIINSVINTISTPSSTRWTSGSTPRRRSTPRGSTINGCPTASRMSATPSPPTPSICCAAWGTRSSSCPSKESPRLSS